MTAPVLHAPNPLPLPERLGADIEAYQVLDCPYRDTTCIHRAIAGGWRAFRCDECPLVPAGVQLRSPGAVSAAAPAAAAEHTCPECDETMRNRQGLELHMSRVHGGDDDEVELLGRVPRPEPTPPPAVDPAVLRRIRDERDGFRARLEEVQDEINALRRKVLEATPRVPPQIVTRLEEVEAETGALKSHVRCLRRALLAARRRAQRAEASSSRARRRARLLRADKRRSDALEADLAALQRVAYQVVEAALDAEAFGRRVAVLDWPLIAGLRLALQEEAA